MWKEGHFDLILMDCQMPKMDGFEATTMIRKTEQHSRNQTYIIALTANAFSEVKDRCIAVGMDEFISKPIDADELHKKLNIFMRNRYLPNKYMQESLNEN